MKTQEDIHALMDRLARAETWRDTRAAAGDTSDFAQARRTVEALEQQLDTRLRPPQG